MKTALINLTLLIILLLLLTSTHSKDMKVFFDDIPMENKDQTGLKIENMSYKDELTNEIVSISSGSKDSDNSKDNVYNNTSKTTIEYTIQKMFSITKDINSKGLEISLIS